MDNSAADFVRFMRHVAIPDDRTDCWLWTGNVVRRYGHFSIGQRSVKAHRWLYDLFNGPIEAGQVVRHHCDTPLCVNPQHLAAGTPAENTADMFSRGRNADRRGENHPLCRLRAEQVLEIRKLAAIGKTQSEIGREFGISNQHVGKIIRRENWRHI